MVFRRRGAVGVVVEAEIRVTPGHIHDLSPQKEGKVKVIHHLVGPNPAVPPEVEVILHPDS